MKKYKILGFTLVELLIVVSILGILATIGLFTFNSAQTRGRDSQRKSDLKQIVSALELYYSDYGSYPLATNGNIIGCPSTTSTSCTWGTGSFSDATTVYFKVLPKDPKSNYSYYYRTINSEQGFQLFAKLENQEDPNCINNNCGTHSDLPAGVVCGSGISCNFALTSPNTTPFE